MLNTLKIRNVIFNYYAIILYLLVMVEMCPALQANPRFVTESEKYHIVKKGDTLFSLSKKYGLTVDNLKNYNYLKSEKIFPGQKIYFKPKENYRQEYVTARKIPANKIHVVEKGETIYRISKMYNLEIMEILQFNDLSSFDIKAGQKIWLEDGHTEQNTAVNENAKDDKKNNTVQKDKKASEVQISNKEYYFVKKGDNLSRIAKASGLSLAELKKINHLKSDKIKVGQKLILQGTIKESDTTDNTVIAVKEQPGEIETNIATPGLLIIPLKGTVISEFGMRNNRPHKGIDIAASTGEPIYAAAEGKVVFEGVQKGYGNVVVLEHKDNIMTVYAHNETNLVRLGDTVEGNQPIATVGQSGNANCPHLHFEYRVKGKAVNPRSVITGLGSNTR